MNEKSELLEYKVNSVSDKTIKIETEMKAVGLKIKEHESNLKILNENFKDQKNSLHNFRNIMNPTYLKIPYLEEDIKKINIKDKEQDKDINEIKINLSELTCICKNYFSKSDEVINEIKNIIELKNNVNKDIKEKIVLNAKAKAIIIGSIFAGVLGLLKVFIDIVVKYNYM